MQGFPQKWILFVMVTAWWVAVCMLLLPALLAPKTAY